MKRIGSLYRSVFTEIRQGRNNEGQDGAQSAGWQLFLFGPTKSPQRKLHSEMIVLTSPRSGCPNRDTCDSCN